MARKSKQKTLIDAIREHQKDIWETLDREQTLDFLKEKFPDNKWELKGGRITGCCPFHSDRTPSFQIYFKKQKIICRGAGCDYNKYQPNFLLFIKDALKISVANAYKILTGRLGVTGINQEYIDANEKFLEEQTDLKAFQRLCNYKLDQMISNADVYNDEKNKEYRPFVDYIRTRGLYRNIHQLPIGLFVPGSEIASYDQDLYVRLNKMLAQHTHHIYKIITFYQNVEGYITHCQVRDNDRGTRPQNMLLVPEIGPGFLGIDLLKSSTRSDKQIFVTEGDFDTLSYYDSILSDPREEPYLLLGTGGNLGYSIDILSELVDEDTGSIGLFFDNHTDRGDDLVISYKKYCKNANYHVFDWRSPNLPAEISSLKDIDDIIQKTSPEHNLGYNFIHNCFKKSNSYFLNIFDWFAHDTKRKLAKLRTEERTPYSQLKIIKNQLKNFTSGSQHTLLTDAIEKLTGVSCQHLTVPSVMGDPDQDQFLADLRDILESEMTFFAKKNNKFYYRNNRLNTVRECTTNSVDLENKLNIDIGPWSTWLQSKMVIPDFIKVKRVKANGVKEFFDPLDLNKNIAKYVHHVVQTILKDLPDEENFKPIGHGLYYNERTKECYLMNGKDIYVGVESKTKTHALGKLTEWKRITTPTFREYFYRIENSRWNPYINSEDDINDDPEDDLAKLYRLLEQMFTFWKTSCDLDAAYLAALAPTWEIQQVFDFTNRLHLQGEKGSGKSKMLNFWTGEDNPDLQLFLSSMSVNTSSEAGWRQNMSNKCGTCVADEFECNPTSPYYKVFLAILTALRPLTRDNQVRKGQINPENNLITGTKSVNYRLRFAVILASISQIITDTGTDTQRFMPIELVHKKGWHSPLDQIREKISDEDFAWLRQFVNRSIYKFVHVYLQSYKEIREESYRDHWYKDATSRTAENIYAAAATWKLLGLPYKRMFMAYLAEKDRRVRSGRGKPQYEQVYLNLMDTIHEFTISADGRKQKMTTWTALASTEYRAHFNGSTTGLEYFPVRIDNKLRHLLFVHWRTVFSSILYKIYKQEFTPDSIKEIAERYKEKVIPPHLAIQLMKDYCPSYQTMLDDITIYDISDRMQPVVDKELATMQQENIRARDISVG